MTSDTTEETRLAEPFTVDIAREMFSFRGKSAAGEGVDVSIVRRHYHPDVRFRDAIQTVQGRDAVIEMLLRFPQRCKELRCHVHRAVQEGDVIFVEWTMEMVVNRRIPTLVDEGISRLVLDDDGMVIDHRDYFDLWGDMIDSFPRASKVYRSIVSHME
jgi:limonene-1,2-epoxide hydrolase